MLEHLNRKKVLRAKILMQNALKRQIPAMCRGEVFESVFPSFFWFIPTFKEI